jgi:hypothetical protein
MLHQYNVYIVRLIEYQINGGLSYLVTGTDTEHALRILSICTEQNIAHYTCQQIPDMYAERHMLMDLRNQEMIFS